MKKYINTINSDLQEQPSVLDPVIERRSVNPLPDINLYSTDVTDQSSCSIVKAIVAGMLGFIIYVTLWLLITMLLGNHFSFILVLIGLVIGIIIQKYGKGTSPLYGIVGGIVVVFASFLGNTLGHTYLLSTKSSDISFLDAISRSDINFTLNLLNNSCGLLDLFFL